MRHPTPNWKQKLPIPNVSPGPRRLPAKVLRNGQLMYHQAYDGPRPITYVDTRLCQDGTDDYIEAFNDEEVIWLRVIRDLLDAHHIPRQNV
jgi:hypothetical protein